MTSIVDGFLCCIFSGVSSHCVVIGLLQALVEWETFIYPNIKIKASFCCHFDDMSRSNVIQLDARYIYGVLKAIIPVINVYLDKNIQRLIMKLVRAIHLQTTIDNDRFIHCLCNKSVTKAGWKHGLRHKSSISERHP